MRGFRITIAGLIVMCMLLGIWNLAAAGSDSPKFNLRMQTPFPPPVTNEDYVIFADKVNKMTNGQITIKYFPGGSLVPTKEILNAVRTGTLDMGVVPEGYFYQDVPVSEVANGLPFSFRNLEEARYFMFSGGFLELLREGYAKQNVYVIPHNTYPIGLMSKMPLTRVEDFKGKKIRAFGVMAAWLGKMGASTTFIPGGELYTALATGVVDGAHWGDAGASYSMKFQEVLKNYMVPEPIPATWNSLIINMDLWKKMTPQQRYIIESALLAYNAFLVNMQGEMKYQRALNSMKKDWGVQVNMIPEDEVQRMREIGYQVWDDVAKKDPLNQKAVDLLREFLKDNNVHTKQVNLKK